MAYDDCFNTDDDGCVLVHAAVDDAAFAQLVAAALRTHTRPPSIVPVMSNSLQGNLCEFCVWDIADSHWGLYELQWGFPANARSPWRDHSDPGVDILALVGPETNLSLCVIEVKSSQGEGSALIFSGKNSSSLRTDFDHPFVGNITPCLMNRIGEICFDLIHKLGRRDLARSLISLVGKNPSECGEVKLVGAWFAQKATVLVKQRERTPLGN